MRQLLRIRDARSLLGRSSASLYALLRRDEKFAALWFKHGGLTVCFEDALQAYLEDQFANARAFPVREPQPMRPRGRPRKYPRPERETQAAE